MVAFDRGLTMQFNIWCFEPIAYIKQNISQFWSTRNRTAKLKTLIVPRVFACRLKSYHALGAPRMHTLRANVVWSQGLERFPLSKPVVGRNIDLHVASAYRASTYLVSAFPAHTFFFFFFCVPPQEGVAYVTVFNLSATWAATFRLGGTSARWLLSCFPQSTELWHRLQDL